MQNFDTLKQLKELQAFGFNEKQAEGIVHSLSAARDFDISTLATKEQVNALRVSTKEQFTSLKEEMSAFKKEVDQRFDHMDKRMDNFATKNHLTAALAEMQANTLKWMVGIMVAFSGIILTAMKIMY